jgi:hypothetical protein
MDMIYEMENNGFSGVKWTKVTETKRRWFRKRQVTKHVQAATAALTEGLCFGYSTVWARKMLEGRAFEDTLPSSMQAGIQKVEMWQKTGGWDNAVTKICKDLGLRVDKKVSPLWSETAREISNHSSGFYIVDIGIHWVAMGRTGKNYFYFDANEGFFTYENREEFRADVNSADNFGYYQANKWMANPGKVCNCYKLKLA